MTLYTKLFVDTPFYYDIVFTTNIWQNHVCIKNEPITNIMVIDGSMRHKPWPLGHRSCGSQVSCHCIRWHSFVQNYTECLKAEDVPLFAVFRLAISLCWVLTVSKALHGLAKSALAVHVRLNASPSSVTLRPLATTVPLVASVQVYEGTGWPSDVHVKTLPGW